LSVKSKHIFVKDAQILLLKDLLVNIDIDNVDILKSNKMNVPLSIQEFQEPQYATPLHLQTFLSLMATGNTIPAMKITDKPRYEYRGLQMDVARNFFDKATVIKVLDIMAMYKLNKLQLNLADEEGWRIEVPGIPELTKVHSSYYFSKYQHYVKSIANLFFLFVT
jgi:hypothetical protein